MSTPGLVVIVNSEGQEICAIYKHHDGEPTSLGAWLKSKLKGLHVSDGIPPYKYTVKEARCFASAECMAAWIVGQMKADKCGEVGLYPAGTRNIGEYHIYEVVPREGGKIWIHHKEGQ